jgi:hypothetical protein
VKSSVAPAVWSAIERYRKAGKTTYVLVYDPGLTEDDPEEVAKAASFLGVNVRVSSFLDI